VFCNTFRPTWPSSGNIIVYVIHGSKIITKTYYNKQWDHIFLHNIW